MLGFFLNKMPLLCLQSQTILWPLTIYMWTSTSSNVKFKNQISAKIIDTFPFQDSWRLKIKMNVTGVS